VKKQEGAHISIEETQDEEFEHSKFQRFANGMEA